MAHINAKNIHVDFPIFNSSHRSFKKNLLNIATGGRLSSDSSHHLIVKALDKINLKISNGDRVALVGHNGSGKSTLLRTMAGVYYPTSGCIDVEGTISTLIDLSQGMEVEATGWDNIILRGLAMGLSLKEINQKVDQVAEFSELGNFLNVPVRTYSSGMTLRLAFAISVCVQRDIVLMDEWLSVGDAYFVEKSSKALRKYLSEASLFVIATHSEDLAYELCNRMIRLEAGRIVSDEKI